MKGGAIVLNGTQVVKIVKNRKFTKILNNPNMKILEECSLEDLEDKFRYWKHILEKPETENNDTVLKYIFKNRGTGETIVSIYDNLDNLKHLINIEEYDRCL